MRRFMFPTTAVLLTVLALHIHAQNNFPDTPAGKKLQQLLTAFESEDSGTFIEQNFSADFLNQFPMEEHLSFFRQVKMMHGGFTLHKIESDEDFRLTALVKSKKREAWRRIDLAVEPGAPHKIAGFGIDMAQALVDVPYTGPKHDLVSKLQPDMHATNKGGIAGKIDEYMTRIEERGYSGAVLVAKGGEIILAKGYGYADRRAKIPFHVTCAFPIGSITKQFTGAAVLKLEMIGKLSTGDPITKYFENVPDDKQSITLHHLLTHSAGFREALGFDYDTISRGDFIKLALDSELEFEPGERYRYSNVGYSILTAVIEMVTGDSYEKFLHDNLFKPAGMEFTGYCLPEWKKNQVAHGYRGDEEFGRPTAKNWAEDGPWWHLRGNGGIISTIHDMYKWHLALEGEDILSQEAKDKYYTPHIPEGPGADTYYGYGWVVAESRRGTKVYMHNGGNPYFANDCYRYVDDDIFVYITSNNGEMSAIEQSGVILQFIFG